MEAKIIVPGFYGQIEDYNLLTLKETKKVSKDAVVLLADLPDFVYIPDENSHDVNAVRRIRIAPNTLLPITNIDEVLKVLTGENIIEGILTKEQKEELICKDIINILKMNKKDAQAGQLAIVKIVKKDGTRPSMGDKFEVFQALENAYEKLGNIKVSQIVPVGISGEEDFITDAKPLSTFSVKTVQKPGIVEDLDKTVYNNVYGFNPTDSYPEFGVEFQLEQPKSTFEAAENGGVATTEAKLINDNGLDSPAVAKLLTGKVVVAGSAVAEKLQLEFIKNFQDEENAGALVLAKETLVEVVPGEVQIVLAKGHVFATLKTKNHGTTNKLVVKSAAAGGPAINWYQVATQGKKDGVLTVGNTQAVLITISREIFPWAEIINVGNLKETVTSVRVLAGVNEDTENYTPIKSGTTVLTFKNNTIKKETTILADGEEVGKAKIKLMTTGEFVVESKTIVKLPQGIKIVLDANTLVSAPTKKAEENMYFDKASDEVREPKYVINYVPEGSEPIMKSLEYAQELTKNLSETLVVWGVKPPESTDPEELVKYAEKLVNLRKFKKGFKKRISASKEVDLGMFLTVVVGSQKINGIGGVTNFSQARVIDFERENGGVGKVKPMTDKLFVAYSNDFKVGMNVEIKTYVGVKLVIKKLVILAVKEVLGKTMLTVNEKIDTTVFSLNGFDVMLSNVDAKDRFGSYTAAAFAVKANYEKDRAPVAQELDGICDIIFPGVAQKKLLENKFTVINVDAVSGKGVVVDCPLMTRNDSDFQERSQIGCVLFFLKKLREIANSKKGKRFPQKEDKVLFEDELREVFKNEILAKDGIISRFDFVADMSRLDSKGYLAAKFKVKDTKKFKTAEFSGGLAKI